jgi:DNA primase catalytic subunit
MGVFGYLSRSHIEHTTVGGSAVFKVEQLESKKASAERRLKNAQTSLDTLDRLTTAEDVLDANFIRNRQKRERASLDNEIKSATADIETIETDLIPLKTENLKLEAEVGPIKYIAELFYGSGDTATVDKAVRLMIIMLIFVFDPLAILLIIAANMTLLGLTKREESGIVDYVVVDEVKPKKVVRTAKKPKKKPVVETPDFFTFEKHENKSLSTHDIPAPDPPRRSWRDGKIIIDENNIRKM